MIGFIINQISMRSGFYTGRLMEIDLLGKGKDFMPHEEYLRLKEDKKFVNVGLSAAFNLSRKDQPPKKTEFVNRLLNKFPKNLNYKFYTAVGSLTDYKFGTDAWFEFPDDGIAVRMDLTSDMQKKETILEPNKRPPNVYILGLTNKIHDLYEDDEKIREKITSYYVERLMEYRQAILTWKNSPAGRKFPKGFTIP